MWHHFIILLHYAAAHHFFGPFHVITYDAIDKIMEPKKRAKAIKPKKGHTLWIISTH